MITDYRIKQLSKFFYWWPLNEKCHWYGIAINGRNWCNNWVGSTHINTNNNAKTFNLARTYVIELFQN